MRERCVIYASLGKTNSRVSQLGFHGNELTGRFVCFYPVVKRLQRLFKPPSATTVGFVFLCLKIAAELAARYRWAEHAWCKPEPLVVAALRCSTAAGNAGVTWPAQSVELCKATSFCAARAQKQVCTCQH